jgi:predicted RNA-binding protein with PUA-like domain
MAQWLVKEEPDHYGYDQLEKDRKTVWAGVRNPLAQKHLRGIKRGDRIFYYHTGKEKAVVATAKAASDAYPDPADASGRMSVVEIVPDKKLPRPVTLAEIKSDTSFASFPLVRLSRLSVMPVTDAEWARIEKLSRSDRS